MRNMNTWIYLKSNNPADVLAMATVMSGTTKTFYVVRRSIYSFTFEGLSNIKVGYYPNTEEDELLIFDAISSDSWQEKCNIMAKQLGLTAKKHYPPYLGFTKQFTEIEEIMENNKSILLYLFPHPNQKLDLMAIEQLVKLFEQKGVKSISGGTNIMPCIRGTKDLRQIMDLSAICSIKDKLEFILTSEESMRAIGEALNLKVYVVSDIEGLTINGTPVSDVNQMANYITMNNKKNN